MIRNRAIKGLLLSIAAFVLLWLLVPKAVFLRWLAATTYMSDAKGMGIILPGIVHGWSVALPMVAFMAVQIAMIYYFTRLGWRWWGYLLMLMAWLAVVALSLTYIINSSNIPAILGRYPTLQEHYILLNRYYGPLKILISIAFMLSAASLGGLVSFLVKDKNLLLPVAMFAAAIDFWTVNYGFVQVALTRTPELVSAVSVPIPHAGTGSFVPNTMIGPGDFLFLGLLFAAVYRLEMDGLRNYWFVFAAMSIGMMAVMFDLLPFLPALTVLAVGIISANYREFKLTRQEKVSVLVVAVVLALSVPVIRGIVQKSQEPDTAPVVTSPEGTPKAPAK